MCRIAGIVNFNKSISTKDWTSLQACSPILEKGGPDAEGLRRNDKSAFLHRRLSIIDTSEAANQPFLSLNGRYQLLFNGEIFNYKELYTSHLAPKNIRLKTASDTEVLLHLFIEYGTAALELLSGFFALCFYDTEEHKAIIARDRFGKKPLVIFEDEDRFIFCSEMKGLMAFDISRKINPIALQLYFQLNYLPPHLSMLQNVRKLSPGHYLEFSSNGITEKSFYSTKIRTEEYNKMSYDEAKKTLIDKMRISVRERMIADVPLGAFLSGGIDSSVVVALAAQETDKLNTFSIGYKDNPVFDETKFAKLVAKKYNTQHQVFYLEETDYKEELFNILDYLDEPFADSSAIPQFILCKKTKKEVTVALSGDGGDEVFAGYNKHKAEWMFRNNKSFSGFAKVTAPIWNALPKTRNSFLGNKVRQMNKFSKGAQLSMKDRFFRWCSILDQKESFNLFSEKTQSLIKVNKVDEIQSEYTQKIQNQDLNEFLLADLNLVLPGDMLHKVDMMSMANALEVRSPFLDYKVVDFAFSIPETYKIDKNLKKRIVQDSFRSMLPEEIYNRPKQGFEIPLLEWFRTDLHSFIFDDLLEKEFVESQGIFDYAEIERIRKKLMSNNPEYIQATIWALIVFQYWYKKYDVSIN